MELYQLRTFVTVAEEGNFTKAGKRVHATQPSVSAHIKALEEELGVRLFDRTPRGVELTVAGSELISDAIEVLASAEKLQARAVTLHGEITGTLSIGLCTDPDFLNVSELLEYMSEQFPKLNLKLIQSPSGLVLNEVRAKNLDAGFVFSGNPFNDVESMRLAEPEYFIVGPTKWQKELQAATPSELSEYTWVMPTSRCPFRELQLKIFRDYAITPIKTVGADSEQVINSLVVDGKALSLVREDEMEALLDSGQAVVCPTLGRHPVELNFVYRKAQTEDPTIQALVTVVSQLWDL